MQSFWSRSCCSPDCPLSGATYTDGWGGADVAQPAMSTPNTAAATTRFMGPLLSRREPGRSGLREPVAQGLDLAARLLERLADRAGDPRRAPRVAEVRRTHLLTP